MPDGVSSGHRFPGTPVCLVTILSGFKINNVAGQPASRSAINLLPWEPRDRGGRRASSQRWATFVRNHADAIVACDFLVAVTTRFQILYVFLILELGSRRIQHFNVTAHPTAEWTAQQTREAFPFDCPY